LFYKNAKMLFVLGARSIFPRLLKRHAGAVKKNVRLVKPLPRAARKSAISAL
jgi:hypothetical protein